MIRHSVVIIVLLYVLILLSGCSTISFYSQSITGHLSLMAKRVPLDKLDLSDPALQIDIALVREIRQFASQELLLPDNNSYQSYVPLERAYPVWNVVAAPSLSVEAHRWCYPIAGCAPYRGYFKESSANSYASRLRQKGLDVIVAGATAYSTLGWFADPLLPTMMRYGQTGLAEIIFHELAHQRLYIKGQSDFNEAFATFVAEQGVNQWLQQTRPQEMPAYQLSLQRHQQFTDLLLQTKSELKAIYQSDASDAQKLRDKAEAFDRMRSSYQHLRQVRWDGYQGFDHWFIGPLNNAKLVPVSTYRSLLPELQKLFDDCGGLASFYLRLEEKVSMLEQGMVPTNCGVNNES